MKNKVSIIIPVYNAEKYLSGCLDSIINQTYKNLEIILVNDGSTDNSLDICNKYKKIDNRIIVLNQKNSGVSKARNKGVLKATGKYVSFVDSDDSVDKNFILKMINCIEENECELSVCNYRRGEKDDDKSEEIMLYSKNEAFYNLINNNNFAGYIWNKLYLRDILIGISSEPFDCTIHVCEDFLLNCKYILKSNKVCYINKKLYIYNVNDSSVTGNKNVLNSKKLTMVDAYKKIIEIYEKDSYENVDYVIYNYLKILLYIKYTAKKANISVNYDKEISLIWIKLTKSKKISLTKKICLFLRVKFPNLTGNLKSIFNYVRVRK